MIHILGIDISTNDIAFTEIVYENDRFEIRNNHKFIFTQKDIEGRIQELIRFKPDIEWLFTLNEKYDYIYLERAVVFKSFKLSVKYGYLEVCGALYYLLTLMFDCEIRFISPPQWKHPLRDYGYVQEKRTKYQKAIYHMRFANVNFGDGLFLIDDNDIAEAGLIGIGGYLYFKEK